MSLPICDICAKTGVLCSACETKLNENKISGVDIELSRLIYPISEGGFGFEKAIDTKDFIIVLTKKEDIGKIIGRNGANIKTLSSALGKPLRVVGVGELKDMIRDFVAPAKIHGINTVYRPDGSVIQRVRIDKRDRMKLRMDVKDVEKLTSSLTENKVEILFE